MERAKGELCPLPVITNQLTHPARHKRQAYVLFKSPQAATATKQKIESFGDGQQYSKKFTVTYTNPFTNPFRTLPKDGPARNNNSMNRSGQGYGGMPGQTGYNSYRGGRGGGYNNRGNLNGMSNYNRGGFQQPMGGGFQGASMGGFQGMGGTQPYGGFQNRGGMVGNMRGGSMGMRGGRGGMAASGMMGMPNMGGMMGGMAGMNMGMPQMATGMAMQGVYIFQHLRSRLSHSAATLPDGVVGLMQRIMLKRSKQVKAAFKPTKRTTIQLSSISREVAHQMPAGTRMEQSERDRSEQCLRSGDYRCPRTSSMAFETAGEIFRF